MFEKAVRNKWRFESSVGSLSVEELWDLPLESRTNRPSLDTVAQSVYNQMKASQEISFVSESSKANKELEDKLELVKYIIKTKKEENAAAVDSRKKREQKEKLMELLEKKQEEGLSSLSVDELRAKIEELGA